MGYDGCYWTATVGSFGFGGDSYNYFSSETSFCGYNVRLVHDADQQWGKASVYSQITFTVDADAEIWVDGEKKGVRSWKGNLTDGSHRIDSRLVNHESFSTTLEIDESKAGQTIALAAPSLFAARSS